MIYSPEYAFICEKCAVLNANNIFPLKEERFENLLLPIPNNPIDHLYEHKIYGKRGDVMNFPKIQDSGLVHALTSYENFDTDFDSIYEELSLLTENYMKGALVYG